MTFSVWAVRKQFYIAGCLYVGELVYGLTLAWPSKVIQKLQDPEETPLSYLISDSEIPWLGSVTMIGALVGFIFLLLNKNRFGRKSCLFTGALIVLLSYALLLYSKSIMLMILVRGFCGIGTAFIFMVNVVYLGEIASKEIRGYFLASTVMFYILGMLLGYIIIPFITYAATQYLGIVSAAIYFIGIIFIPESPMYEFSKGNKCRARNVMETLGRLDDFSELAKVQELQNNNNKLSELFTERTNRKALIISSVLYVSQHFSGTVCINTFATIIFEMADSSIQPDLATIIMGATQLVSCVIGSATVERFGRKKLLLISSAMVALAQFGLGTYFYIYAIDKTMVGNVGWLPLMFLMIVFTFYNMGFGQIPGTLMGEMFTQDMRSTGSSVSLMPAMLLGSIISVGFGYVILAVGNYIPFWFFSCTCALTFLFTVLYVPETKGKSLIEIQILLNK